MTGKQIKGVRLRSPDDAEIPTHDYSLNLQISKHDDLHDDPHDDLKPLPNKDHDYLLNKPEKKLEIKNEENGNLNTSPTPDDSEPVTADNCTDKKNVDIVVGETSDKSPGSSYPLQDKDSEPSGRSSLRSSCSENAKLDVAPFPKTGDLVVKKPYKGNPQIWLRVIDIAPNGDARARIEGAGTESGQYNISQQAWQSHFFESAG
jgi:hypothetical protein